LPQMPGFDAKQFQTGNCDGLFGMAERGRALVRKKIFAGKEGDVLGNEWGS